MLDEHGLAVCKFNMFGHQKPSSRRENSLAGQLCSTYGISNDNIEINFHFDGDYSAKNIALYSDLKIRSNVRKRDVTKTVYLIVFCLGDDSKELRIPIENFYVMGLYHSKLFTRRYCHDVENRQLLLIFPFIDGCEVSERMNITLKNSTIAMHRIFDKNNDFVIYVEIPEIKTTADEEKSEEVPESNRPRHSISRSDETIQRMATNGSDGDRNRDVNLQSIQVEDSREQEMSCSDSEEIAAPHNLKRSRGKLHRLTC